MLYNYNIYGKRFAMSIVSVLRISKHKVACAVRTTGVAAIIRAHGAYDL